VTVPLIDILAYTGRFDRIIRDCGVHTKPAARAPGALPARRWQRQEQIPFFTFMLVLLFGK
jgi:hypothetical protein